MMENYERRENVRRVFRDHIFTQIAGHFVYTSLPLYAIGEATTSAVVFLATLGTGYVLKRGRDLESEGEDRNDLEKWAEEGNE
jgi:hypothetical protein